MKGGLKAITLFNSVVDIKLEWYIYLELIFIVEMIFIIFWKNVNACWAHFVFLFLK